MRLKNHWKWSLKEVGSGLSKPLVDYDYFLLTHILLMKTLITLLVLPTLSLTTFVPHTLELQQENGSCQTVESLEVIVEGDWEWII